MSITTKTHKKDNTATTEIINSLKINLQFLFSRDIGKYSSSDILRASVTP